MFTSLIQLLGNKLHAFFTTFFNVFKDIVGPNIDLSFSFLSSKKDVTTLNKTDLFNIPSTYNNFSSLSKTLHSCAVGEFDYDFTSPNPFNWELKNLILPSQPSRIDTSNNRLADIHQDQNDSVTCDVPYLSDHNTKQPSPKHLDIPIQTLDSTQSQNQSSIELLNNFTTNFQNQLKNNELFHIYNNQNNNEILDFSDDEFDNNDNDHYNDTNFTIIKQDYSYIERDDDILPLDDELMFSIVRNQDQHKHIDINQCSDSSRFLLPPNSNDSTNIPERDSTGSETRIEVNYKINNNIEFDNLTTNTSHFLNEEKKHLLNDTSSDTISFTSSLKPRKKYKKLLFHSKLSKDYSSITTSSSSSSSLSSSTTTTSTITTNPLSAPEKVYTCAECNAAFKVKGYLTRHKKKHSTSKPFQCPFFGLLIDCKDKNNSFSDLPNEKIIKCHPTGGFSRRDTFKTHLKALHFVYPTGTKSGDRSDKKGRCAACFQEFSTNKEWLETHVMTNKCDGMLTKYK